MAFWRRPTIWDKIAETPKASLSLTVKDVQAEMVRLNSLLVKYLRTPPKKEARLSLIEKRITNAHERLVIARSALEYYDELLRRKDKPTLEERKKIRRRIKSRQILEQTRMARHAAPSAGVLEYYVFHNPRRVKAIVQEFEERRNKK